MLDICTLYVFSKTVSLLTNSKVGPWFKYVNAFMIPNSKLTWLINQFVPVSPYLFKVLTFPKPEI